MVALGSGKGQESEFLSGGIIQRITEMSVGLQPLSFEIRGLVDRVVVGGPEKMKVFLVVAEE